MIILRINRYRSQKGISNQTTRRKLWKYWTIYYKLCNLRYNKLKKKRNLKEELQELSNKESEIEKNGNEYIIASISQVLDQKWFVLIIIVINRGIYMYTIALLDSRANQNSNKIFYF